MMYFWSFFLLAFVVNSVHSDVSLSNSVIEDKCSKAMEGGLKKIDLNLGDLSVAGTGVVSSVVKFPGVTVKNFKPIKVEYTFGENKCTIKVSIGSELLCTGMPTSPVEITINAPFTIVQDPGCKCPRWQYDDKLAVIDIKLQGTNVAQVGTLLDQVSKVIKEAVDSVFKLVAQKLNHLTDSVTSTRSCCGTECSMNNYAILITQTMTTIKGCNHPKGSDAACEADDAPPTIPINAVWALTSTSKKLELGVWTAVKTIVIKIQVPTEISIPNVPPEAGPLSITVDTPSLSNCAYKSHGADISITVNFGIHNRAGTKLITGQAVFTAKVNIQTKNHCLGLTISSDFTIELKGEPKDNGCCAGGAKEAITKILNYILQILKQKLDCNLGCIHPVPRLDGATPICTPGEGNCNCVGKKS